MYLRVSRKKVDFEHFCQYIYVVFLFEYGPDDPDDHDDHDDPNDPVVAVAVAVVVAFFSFCQSVPPEFLIFILYLEAVW